MRFRLPEAGRGQSPPAPQLLFWGPAAWCPTHRAWVSPQDRRGAGVDSSKSRGPHPCALQFPHLSNVGVGLGRLQHPSLPPPPATTVPNSGTAPATPGRARPSQEGHPQARARGEGAPGGRVSPRGGACWRRTWGPRGGGARSRPRGFVCIPAGVPAREREAAGSRGGCSPRPPPGSRRSPGLRAAAASRARRPRLGSARLGGGALSPRPRRARRAGREEPPGPARARRRRGLRGDWPRPLEPRARPRRLGRAPGARGGEPAETKVTGGGGRGGRGGGARGRGGEVRPGAGGPGGGRPAGRGACRAHEPRRPRCNFAGAAARTWPVRCAAAAAPSGRPAAPAALALF